MTKRKLIKLDNHNRKKNKMVRIIFSIPFSQFLYGCIQNKIK